MTIILYMGNSLFLPNYFSFGRDVESAINIDDDVFYKKFKSYKYDNFCKTIFILQTLKKSQKLLAKKPLVSRRKVVKQRKIILDQRKLNKIDY